MIPRRWRALNGVMLQHWFDDTILFQHRNMAKWTTPPRRNRRIGGFENEERCLEHLEKLHAARIFGEK
ncbi:MAG: hypothetical protein AAF585_03580 [Verrucomicrobiota bacterium]